MKTIVIIENEAVELAALVHLFQQWQKKINIITAKEEEAAISILAKQHVDLLVCDLSVPGATNLDNFAMLTHSFPYIPCIALSHRQSDRQAEVLRRGASRCLAKPVDAGELLNHAGELLDTDANGTVKGIPVHSFLQMLESEKKTCTLQVERPGDRGLLYVREGRLIGAETRNFIGEEAAHLILCWPESVIQIRHFNGQRPDQIDKSLISVIMAAFRLKQERDALLAASDFTREHQLPLKHLAVAGKKLPLEIGSRVNLEFPRQELQMEADLVGMLPDRWLITTNPQPRLDHQELIGTQLRVLFKYINKGRTWMFRASLLKTMAEPDDLLFFEYPGVIHFHELRRHRRSAIHLPCTLHRKHGHEHYGRLIDLSTGGGLLLLRNKARDAAKPPAEINEEVVLRCLLPGVKDEQTIDGAIRNVAMDQEEVRVGVEFTSLESPLSDTIGKFLHANAGGVQ